MVSVTLTGGSPWGFKMLGGKDFHLPLTISKVSPGGKADTFGVPEGYILQKINGKDVSNMSHHEAQILIKCAKSYLQLHLSKPDVKTVQPRESSTSTAIAQSQWSVQSASSFKTPHRQSSEINQSTSLFIAPNLERDRKMYRSNNPVTDVTENLTNVKFNDEFSDEKFKMTNPSKHHPRNHNFSRGFYESNRNFQTNDIHYGDEPKQSPSLYMRTLPPKVEAKNGEKPTLFISHDMKRMIFDSDDDQLASEEDTRAKVKRQYPKEHKLSSKTTLSRRDLRNESYELGKMEAARNIGKFIENSKHGKPVFAKALHDQTGTLYDPLVLEIRLGADLPAPSVHWYHNNTPLRESRDRDITILCNGRIHTVVLGELRSDLLGTYTCTIVNKHGSQSCHCDVTANEYERPPPTGHFQHRHGSSMDSSSTLSTSSTGRRIVVNSSADLYSPRVVHEAYCDQVGRTPTTPRGSLERSEVAKVLREDPPIRHHRKTPSMKLLEESLLSDSVDL